MTLNQYGIKFKEKGKKKPYISIIFSAKDQTDLNDQLEIFLKQEDYNIDRRTISWAGGSVPLNRGCGPLMIYANLDDFT